MNTRANPLSPLCIRVQRAGLVRTGAALVLALAAAQAGAVTHTVPLQFNLTLTAPVCSLTVDTATADAATPTATGVTVNLTPTAMSTTSSPNTIANTIPGFTAFTASAAGIYRPSGIAVTKRMDSPPTASVTCSAGTPMTVRLAQGPGTFTHASLGLPYMAGKPGAGQPGTLPIGMLMGLASFGAASSANGAVGTTLNATEPSLGTTATGSAQALNLTAAIYANSTTLLTASEAGLWTYHFNVNLDF